MTEHYLKQAQETGLRNSDEDIQEVLQKDGSEYDESDEKDKMIASKISFFNFPFFQWKTFFFFLTCCIGITLHWMMTSEIFKVPHDVSHSRKKFFTAKEHYEKNREYWDAKQVHFVNTVRKEIAQDGDKTVWHLLEQVSSEILLSFLIRELEIHPKFMGQLAIASKKGSASSFKVILSKYEQGIWPLKIMLSLEMEFKIQSDHFAIEFTRLRKGAQDMSIGLCWAYFGPELAPLKKVELFDLPTINKSTFFSSQL